MVIENKVQVQGSVTLQSKADSILAVFKEGNLLNVAVGIRPKNEILGLIDAAVNKQGD